MYRFHGRTRPALEEDCLARMTLRYPASAGEMRALASGMARSSRSPTLPRQVMWPSSMIITMSAVRATSSMRCVETMTTRSRPSATMCSRKLARSAGSSPTVGSSRMTTDGSCTKAAARNTRWRCPPDKVPIVRSRNWEVPVISTAVSMSPLTRDRGTQYITELRRRKSRTAQRPGHCGFWVTIPSVLR